MQGMQNESGPKAQCLVIEDSHFDQKMIDRAMKGAHVHAEISYADTLEKAREALAQHSFSLIVMDNKLPRRQRLGLRTATGAGSWIQRRNNCNCLGLAVTLLCGTKPAQPGCTSLTRMTEPQPKLRDFFRHKLRRNRRAVSVPSSEYSTKYAH